MVQSETTGIKSQEDFDKLLKTEITGGYISDKFIMPRPNDGGKVVRILWSKDNKGELCPMKVVKNSKFKDGNGVFMTVAEIDQPEVELQMGVGESIKNAVKRMLNSEGWNINDLPDKIVHITANYYTSERAAKCSKCHGKGCVACENTGYSTVFNMKARRDLMSPTKQTKKVADEF